MGLLRPLIMQWAIVGIIEFEKWKFSSLFKFKK